MKPLGLITETIMHHVAIGMNFASCILLGNGMTLALLPMVRPSIYLSINFLTGVLGGDKLLLCGKACIYEEAAAWMPA